MRGGISPNTVRIDRPFAHLELAVIRPSSGMYRVFSAGGCVVC